jgi:hypothetical protein
VEGVALFLGLIAKMSDGFLEQRMDITFCMKLQKNASDTYAMVYEGYGGEAMKKSSVSEWYKRFKESRENVENENNAHYFFRYQVQCSF